MRYTRAGGLSSSVFIARHLSPSFALFFRHHYILEFRISPHCFMYKSKTIFLIFSFHFTACRALCHFFIIDLCTYKALNCWWLSYFDHVQRYIEDVTLTPPELGAKTIWCWAGYGTILLLSLASNLMHLTWQIMR